MTEIHCDVVKYSYKDMNQEMWKNSKKFPWRVNGSIFQREGWQF